MWRTQFAAAITAVIVAAPSLALAGPPSRPIAPKRPVTDTYWGVEVVDDYQYLEQVREAQRLSAAWIDERNFEVKSSPRFRATSRPDMRFGAKALAPAAGEGPTDEPEESAAPTPSG